MVHWAFCLNWIVLLFDQSTYERKTSPKEFHLEANEPVSVLVLPSIFDNNPAHSLYVFSLDNVSFVRMANHVLDTYRNSHNSISAYWLENDSTRRIRLKMKGERERKRERKRIKYVHSRCMYVCMCGCVKKLKLSSANQWKDCPHTNEILSPIEIARWQVQKSTHLDFWWLTDFSTADQCQSQQLNYLNYCTCDESICFDRNPFYRKP